MVVDGLFRFTVVRESYFGLRLQLDSFGCLQRVVCFGQYCIFHSLVSLELCMIEEMAATPFNIDKGTHTVGEITTVSHI